MLRIKTILHPTDFSSYAGAALDHAVYWSRLFGAELHLLHTLSAIGSCEIEEVTTGPTPSKADSIHRQHAQEMRRLVDAAEAGDLTVRYFLAHSPDPSDAILTHAQAVSADLIMMGTRGLGQTDAPCLGSIAASVMQRSKCPVLFAHGAEKDIRQGLPVGRILVYIDFTQQTCALLELAGALAVHFQCSLDLLYVTQTERLHLSTTAATDDESDLEERVKKRLLQVCTKASELEKATSSYALEVRFHVRTGHPADVVLAFVREHAEDLMMMVVPGISSTEYAPLEAMAERIVHEASCPVLIVNPAGTSLVAHASTEATRSAASPGAAMHTAIAG